MDSGRKKRGRPLFTWIFIINNDLKKAEMTRWTRTENLAKSYEEYRPQKKWDKANTYRKKFFEQNATTNPSSLNRTTLSQIKDF